MEQVKFYITEDETFECGFERPTMIIKDKYLEINLEMINEQKKIDEKYPKMMDVKRLTNSATLQNDPTKLSKMVELMSDTEVSHEFTKYSGELQKIIDIFNIFKLQLVLQTRHLTEEQLKLINSDPDSGFWKMQDLSEIDKALTFFRENNKIG